MKTRINKKIKESMGLEIVNGVITDMYGRTFETYTDAQGYEDIRPIGVQRDMTAYYQIRGKK